MSDHSVLRDSGELFQIIPNTRRIVVPASHRIIGTVKSHNSEQLTFKCPKTIDGHDVVNCTDHWVIWQNAKGKKGRTEVKDITCDGEYMYFTWVVISDVTAASGYIKFSVLFEDIDDGKIDYSWGTTTCNDCHVLETLTYSGEDGGDESEPEVPEGYVKPNGNISITENNTYNVTPYRTATVSVPQITLEEQTFTENGVFTPEDNKGFGRTVVNVQPNLQEKTATENGEVVADSGFYGLEKVTVDVQPNLQEKTATGNGEVIPDEGFDGLSKVIVAVEGDVPVYYPIKVTENGKTYTPEGDFDAFSSVTVDIPLVGGSATPSENSQTKYPSGNAAGFSYFTINPIPDSYVQPSGTAYVESNGTFDVKEYSKVNVDVPSDAKPEQNKNVTLSFANGNQTVTPDSGFVLSKVTIAKPSNLIPENIRKGVVIAGVVGAYEGYGDSETMYVGASTNTSLTGAQIGKLKPYDAISSTIVVEPTSTSYIYICVPTTKTVTAMTVSGLDGFSMIPDVPGAIIELGDVTISSHIYRVYRTNTTQRPGAVPIKITLE